MWRISTGDLTALTKSATQAYLLFPFLFLCFLQWQWNISYEVINSIQVFGLLTRIIKSGQLAAKLGTHRCGFWGLTERIVFLTWKKIHFWFGSRAFCFLPHEWKYRFLHLLASYNSFACSLRFSCSRKWTSEKMADILRHHHPCGFPAKWRLKQNERCLVPRHHYSPRLMRFRLRSSPICHRNALTEKTWEDAETGLGTRHCRPESLLGAWARGPVGSGDTGFEVLDFRTSGHFRFKSVLEDSLLNVLNHLN